MKALELTGKQFGKLTVIEFSGKSPNGHYKWLVRCECGNETTVFASNLNRGHTISCGCENTRVITKHGMAGTRTHNTWRGMVERCLNPNAKRYKWYGGRGITVCYAWTQSFEAFYADMGERPKGKTLDRIENNKGYYKENCRWATPEEQNRNKRQRQSKVYYSGIIKL